MLYPNRELRVCYLNTEPRLVDREKLHVEEKLKVLGNVDLVFLKSIEDPSLHPCDLLIITAEQIPDEDFYKWITGFSKRITTQASIWVPALIISKIPFVIQKKFLLDAVQSNWYFDVISPDHIESLPIRVANLLRIHDHLHEVKRYQETLIQLQDKVDLLSNELQQMKDSD